MIVLVWGVTSILGRLITLDPVVIVVWRTGIAALAMLGILLVIRLPWPPWRELLPIMGGGALIGAHWVLFFLSGRVGAVSVGLAGVSTLALWVALLEPLFIRGRRWSWVEGLLAAGVTVGMLMLDFSDRGLLIGVAAASLAAGLSILNARLVLKHPALMISFIEMATACGFCFGAALLTVPAGGLRWIPAAGDWLWLLILALVCTVFAFSACVQVQRRVSAFSMGMASNLEPIYGMTLAPMVFGAAEHQGLSFYVGSAVIIGFVALHTTLTARGAAWRNRSAGR
ncbi:MAG: family transporter [Verrucomicrobiales bacterium]|nr:family transporter [Verrucomicrobiales bacterium]